MEELRSIYNTLNSIQNDCISIFDNFRDNIFSDIDYYAIEGLVPMWIRDAGNSAECGFSKELFERIVRENNNVLTHKFLYKYDCDMLVASLQDRFSMISTLIERFYKKMPMKSSFKMEDFTSATMSMSDMDADTFAYLNSIFIFLGSSFDLMAKIYSELNNIDTIDYSIYPNLKSKNILFGDNKHIHDKLKSNDLIFSRPAIVKKVETIRNRIVHDGSFDFRQIIYIGYHEKDDYSESCIMFPDFRESYFESYKNRRNFYSKSDRINLLLPEILIDVLRVIHTTINKANELYQKDRYCNEKDITTYKQDILNWSKSAFKILSN